MTFNQDYFDAAVRHQIDLLRYGSGVAREVNAILDETRADLRKQVERRLGKSSALDSAGIRRLRELERAIDQQRSGAWNDVNELWTRSAVDVALEEPLFIEGQLTSILPVELDLVQPSAGTLRALATTRPFDGKTLKEWSASVRAADLARIHQQIRIGMVQGESARDIANRVFGAKGAMAITANQAEAVTRTVIAGTANAAQQEFLAGNSDLFEAEQMVATLDSRTTLVCMKEDGRQYPVGKGPMPPLHVRCRTIRVAAIDGEVVGERPFKAGTEKQMLREYAAARGMGTVPKSRDDLPRGSKKDYDAFARRRMKELTGQVPAHTTYQEWLKRQSPAFQDDVLGPARGKLFRDGGLTLDRFVNRQGDELTLEEIRERNEAAWKASGLKGETSPESETRARSVTPEPAPEPEPEPTAATTLASVAGGSGARFVASGATSESVSAAMVSGLERAGISRFYTNGKALDELQVIGAGGTPSDAAATLGATTYGRYQSQRNRLLLNGSEETLRRGAKGYTLKDKISPGRAIPGKGGLRPDVPANVHEISKTPETVAEITATHEFGHAIHMHSLPPMKDPSGPALSEVDRVIKSAFDDPKREAVSKYADANRLEYWAESFAAYHHYPRDWMRSNAPKALQMVETVLRMRGLL